MNITARFFIILSCFTVSCYGEDTGKIRGLLIKSPDFTQLLFIESSGNVSLSYFHGYGNDMLRKGDDIHCAYLINLDQGVSIFQSETNFGKSLRIERNKEVFPVSGLTKISIRKEPNVELCLFIVLNVSVLPGSIAECLNFNMDHVTKLSEKGLVEMAVPNESKGGLAP